MNFSKMTFSDVVKLYTQLENLGIDIWLDGGWAVDALLGQQTRSHNDVDIVIQKKDLSQLNYLLELEGYKDIPQNDTSPWNFVLGDDLGHKIDVHVIVFDKDGNGLYGPIENGNSYPIDSLSGVGNINGYTLKCISPEYLVKFHTGYQLREHDFKDVTALCEKFNVDYPIEYTHSKE